MEEPIDSKNSLYRNALPDFISLFWAYCRARMQDGMQLIHPGYIGRKGFYIELLHASDFVVEVDIHIQMTLQGLMEEFYFLITGRNKSFIDDVTRGVAPNLKNKYEAILRKPEVIQLVNSIETYMKEDSYLRGNQYIGDRNFKVSNSGLHTAADTATWGSILSYALGEKFNINAFLRVAASVDLLYVHDFVEGLGVVTQRSQEDRDDRHVEYLDPSAKSYTNTAVAGKYTLPSTKGCPAMLPPSESMEKFIAENFPNCNAKESMIVGIGREIPLAIRNLIQDFINDMGIETFRELIAKQEPILRDFLKKGIARMENSEIAFR